MITIERKRKDFKSLREPSSLRPRSPFNSTVVDGLDLESEARLTKLIHHSPVIFLLLLKLLGLGGVYREALHGPIREARRMLYSSVHLD